MRSLHLPPSQRQERPNVRDVLQRFEHGDQMQKVVVRRVIDPAFDRYRIVFIPAKNKCQPSAVTTLFSLFPIPTWKQEPKKETFEVELTHLHEKYSSTDYYPKS